MENEKKHPAPKRSNNHFLIAARLWTEFSGRKQLFFNFFFLKDWVVFQHLYSKLRLVWSNKNYERNSTKCLELLSVEKLTIWGKC